MSALFPGSRIPLTVLDNADPNLLEELLETVGRLASVSAFTGGPEVEAFEHEFASYCGTAYAVGLASGTAAVTLGLRALRIGPGDEVVIPANSFIATAEAVSLTGARPRFADVDPDTQLVTAATIERALTPAVGCIIPVHLYGRTVDLHPILELASEAGIHVAEDACQAHGARYHGRPVGSFGDFAAFSFYPAKNLGAWGDAGALVTQSEELANEVRLIRSHGEHPRYHHRILGETARLDAIQAAVLRVKLRGLDRANDARREIGTHLALALEDSSVTPPAAVGDGTDHVFHQFVVRSPFRDRLRLQLRRAGISTGIHYPVPIHLAPHYSASLHGHDVAPVTTKLAGEICSLPMFPSMPDWALERIIDAVRSFVPADQEAAIA
jgi:dTDP-3-amino-3,4,6-trideoxy-alpha-D-glucose transaminase